MSKYPLKFRRKERNIQPRIKTDGEFRRTVFGFTKVWGFDSIMMSLNRKGSLNSNIRRKKSSRKRQHRIKT